MGLRYRRRVRVSKNTHLNVGTQKASVSVGKPGLTVNASRRGVRATVGLPGTGLSYVTKQAGGSRKKGSLAEELFYALAIVLVLGAIKLVFRGFAALFGALGSGSSSAALPSAPVEASETHARPIGAMHPGSAGDAQAPFATSTLQLPSETQSQSSSPDSEAPGGLSPLAAVLAVGGLGTIVLVAIVANRFSSMESTQPRAEASVARTQTAESTAVADVAAEAPPTVPSLRPNEVPPRDMPNYFDPTELGGATTALAVLCGEITSKAAQGLKPEMRAPFCLCYADAARLNFKRSQSPTVTKHQYANCLKFSRNPASVTPYGKSLPSSTAGILSAMNSCLNDVPADTSPNYGVRVCTCKIDAIGKHKTATSEDLDRCGIAARYAERTGTNLTVRQFQSL